MSDHKFFRKLSPDKLILNNGGMSLVAVLVALGMLGILIVGFSKWFTSSLKGVGSIELRQSISNLQQSVKTRLDCSATLGVTGSSSLPLTCSDYSNVAIKDKGGNVISTMGAWSISATCNNNVLIVKATASGNDPLTGKAKSQTTTGPGTTVSTDLFGGTGQFCGSYFSGNSSGSCATPFCTKQVGTFATSIGNLTKTTTTGCGALTIQPGQTNTHYSGSATCPAGYYAVGGGAHCQVPPAGGTMLDSEVSSDGLSWTVKCCVYVNAATPNVYTGSVFVTCIQPN
jgi:type II secretory pathway pseudopilin PulG